MYFFLIVLGIMTFVYSYVGWRIIVPLGLSHPMNILASILMLVLLGLPFISILLRIYEYHNYFIYLLTWISYLSLGFVTLVFLFLVVRDLGLFTAVIISKLFAIVRSFTETGASPPNLLNPERHLFIVRSLNLFILGLTGILTVWGIYSALHGPRIVNVTIPIENLNDNLDGFRIVQITDIHAGSTIRRPYVQKIVDMVNSLDGDAVVFTGDVADGKVSTIKEYVAPLAELAAPYGKFFVTGNHEYYSGVEDWIGEMPRLGFEVLLNEHRIISYGGGRVLLAGVTDYDGGQFLESHVSNPEASLSGAQPGDVTILLTHQPRSIFRAAAAGFDLVISGHTHGGQYFPWNFFIGLQQPYTAGLHRHGKTFIYVSRGSGYWGPPLRGGIPSEITVITLRKP
ncbi:MAG: metallophosphoesterase [Candidatus Latescibacteria bacterium]|jgi:uncharacterized protein|nr:metallophosphoesterase [Candidatus Latescibacterota bacterium]